MSSLFSRARAYQPLTPAERAVLKLLEGLLCAALVAVLPIVAQALARNTISWSDVTRTALAAAAVAVLLALAKYARAHGDPAMADALAATGAALSARAVPSGSVPDTLSSETRPAA